MVRLGEKAYNNCSVVGANFFSSNPYRFNVVSPYGMYSNSVMAGSLWRVPRVQPSSYTLNVQQTVQLNARLNAKAQANIDAKEPEVCIWEVDQLAEAMAATALDAKMGAVGGSSASEKGGSSEKVSEKQQLEPQQQQQSVPGGSSNGAANRKSWFKKILPLKTPEEKEAKRLQKLSALLGSLRNAILQEEHGRWPTQEWRRLVVDYQNKVGMTSKIAQLRMHAPVQYLHLLRAGYFEPIPVAWADQLSNPLKFTIEAAEGWRGITPAWRGYEDTAEERLYWVLNHRDGSENGGGRLKPDMISALNMARARMMSAVEPPPQYFSPNDTCHLQHTSEGYSKQVMAPPFRAFDAPETAADDTMILLDVSGSMDFDPMRPNYNEYLITGYSRSTQPKNKGEFLSFFFLPKKKKYALCDYFIFSLVFLLTSKSCTLTTDVAKAIIRRFVDAMINHSHSNHGYELVTFANHAAYMGVVNHQNFESVWRNVQFGGTTRVMTGWQRCKRLHFEKHRASATHHPVYGWQAGPETPMLRLLLLLDGEATDMDEFELDLLGNAWAHVTIFLIGVDGCPHHHRHANELQRISEVNHHVSFVDAQGNMPERFVTHELLKRHLGYEVSMAEFEVLEQPPAYTAI